MTRQDEYIKIYVVWRCDEDDFFVTLIEGVWTLADWNKNKDDIKLLVQWAHDQEFPNEPNRILNGESYDYITSFYSPADIEFGGL